MTLYILTVVLNYLPREDILSEAGCVILCDGGFDSDATLLRVPALEAEGGNVPEPHTTSHHATTPYPGPMPDGAQVALGGLRG